MIRDREKSEREEAFGKVDAGKSHAITMPPIMECVLAKRIFELCMADIKLLAGWNQEAHTVQLGATDLILL